MNITKTELTYAHSYYFYSKEEFDFVTPLQAAVDWLSEQPKDEITVLAIGVHSGDDHTAITLTVETS